MDVSDYIGQTVKVDFSVTPSKLNGVKNIGFGCSVGDEYNSGAFGTNPTKAFEVNRAETFTLNSSLPITKKVLSIGMKVTYDEAQDIDKSGIIDIVLDNMSLFINDVEIPKDKFIDAGYDSTYSGECHLINLKYTPIFKPVRLISRFQGKRYLAIGDSITAGMLDSSDSNLRYPEKVKEILGCSFVKNIARSGMNMSTANSNSFGAIYKRNSYNYDLITIALGLNDGGADGSVCEIGDVDSRDTATFLGAYNVVLEHIFKCNPYATVVLLPMFHGSYVRVEFIQAIYDIGKKYNCPVFDFNTYGINTINQDVYHDGLHYMEHGHTIIANKLAQFLTTI